MKSPRIPPHRYFVSILTVLATALCRQALHAAVSVSVSGWENPPAWWQVGECPVIDPAAESNNLGPANIGQAKWMALRALETLDTLDPDLAAGIRDGLTLPQPRPDDPRQFDPAILSFEIPQPLPADWHDRQHAPLLIGQLKAIATPFYDQLRAATADWLDHESSDPATQGQLQLNGTKDPNDPANFLPWSADPGDDQNHAPATIGQLKAVFSLRFETMNLMDSDRDGLPDWWEMLCFSNLEQTGMDDADLDGITNLQAFLLGINPNKGNDGAAPIPAGMIPVTFRVGDPSGSLSEMWNMRITGQGPDDHRSICLASPCCGEMGERTVLLIRNNRYEITLEHLDSDPWQLESYWQPDYDWEAQIDGKPQTSVLPAGATHAAANACFMIQNHWLVDNNDGLLGVVDQSFYTTDFTQGKKASLIPFEMIPDYNRDGIIDQNDRGKATQQKPWRFWNNDDHDIGETEGNDIPHDTQEDFCNTSITSMRDLIDYFPVRLEIRYLLETLPEDQYSYWLSYDPVHFMQTPGTSGFRSPFLKVAWNPEAAAAPDGNSLNSGAWQKDLEKASMLLGKELHLVNPYASAGTATSIMIPPAMLQSAKAGNGLIWLSSGLASITSSAPLELKVKDSNNNVIASCSLPLSISSVEDMFRHKNLRSVAGGNGGKEDREQCANYPDTLCNTDWLVFLHGYNVNGEYARGWHCEAFKRFFWSGSNARFVGISWYGDESQSLLGVTPKYFENVENALNTSEHFANYMNGLNEGTKYVVTHSLGGLVAAEAIASYSANVTKAFLINPAFPTESLLPGTISNDAAMEPISWRPYPEEIKSSDWYRLFPGTDSRSKLTWRGRFHAVTSKLKIFYSPGEEVLTAMPLDIQADPGWANEGPQGKYAFALQAQLKGMYNNEPVDIPGALSWITHNLGSFSPASMYGGWGKAVGFQSPKYTTTSNIFRDPSWFQALLNGQNKPEFLVRLQEDPPFRVTPSGLLNIFDTSTTPSGCEDMFDNALGPQLANTAWKAHRILAQMIPERSLPAGGAGGSGVDGQVDSLVEKFADAQAGSITTYNMEENRNGWPAERQNGIRFGDGWRHGDVRDVAYPYVWKIWREVVDNANLDQKP